MTTPNAPGIRPPLRPDPDSLAAFYWEGARLGELRLQRCSSCRLFIHYPRPVCRRCLSRELAPEAVSGRGVVHAHTVMEQAFHPFYADRVPYVVALIELEEQTGLRVLSNVIDCAAGDVTIGMPVEVAFETVGPALTLPVFRPRSAP